MQLSFWECTVVQNVLCVCLCRSSQYGWRGSELSVGEGVLDSGKASDLSVCSWPVEPIHWTPFPILQQLSSHGAATVSVTAPPPPPLPLPLPPLFWFRDVILTAVLFLCESR